METEYVLTSSQLTTLMSKLDTHVVIRSGNVPSPGTGTKSDITCGPTGKVKISDSFFSVSSGTPFQNYFGSTRLMEVSRRFVSCWRRQHDW